MLTKLLIIPFIFVIAGFGEYSDDNMRTPNVDISVDDWSSQLEKEIQAKKEVKRARVFKDIEIEDNPCGTNLMPIRVGVIKNNPPFSWQFPVKRMGVFGEYDDVENDGLIQKLAAELMKSFGNPLYNIAYLDGTKSMEKALQRGEIDIGIGIPYNPDPLLGIDYVYPAFFSNPIVAIFKNKKDADSINNFTDLKDLRGIAAADKEGLAGMIASFKSSEGGIKIISPNISLTEMYDYLLYNRINYILTSLYFAKAYKDEYELENDIYFSSPIRAQQQFIGFSKNSDCRAYKEYIEEFLEDDVFSRMEKLYYDHVSLWKETNSEILPYKERQKVKESGSKRTQKNNKAQNLDEDVIKKNVVPVLKY